MGCNGTVVSGTKSQRGLKAILQSMFLKVGVIAVNAGTGILTARILAPAGRGEQSAIALWPTFLSFAGTFGLPIAISFQMKKHFDQRAEFLGAGLLVSLCMSVLVGLAAALAMPLLLVHYPPSVIAGARMLLLMIPAAMLMFSAKGFFEVMGQFSTSVMADLLVPFLTLLTLVTLSMSHRLTPFTAACAYTLTYVPVSLFLVRRMLRILRPSLHQFSQRVRTLLSYGFRAYGIDLCGTLALYVDQALVVNLLSPGAMGMYVVALSVSRMLNVCQTSVVMVLLPTAVGNSVHQIVQLTARAARASFLLTAIMAAAVFAVAPFAVHLLYGSRFAGSVPILRVLVIEVTIAGTVSVLAQAAMALGRPGVIATLQIIGLLITVPLMFLLLPKFGVIGAAISLLISTSIRAVLLLAAFRFVLRTPVPRVWITPGDLQEFWGISRELAARFSERRKLVEAL